jgi:S-formylglutathione hydrolase FrmB
VQGLGFRTADRSITWMSPGARTAASSQTWLDNLGDWAWPGQHLATAEVLPPSWVPADPPALPRREPAAAPLPAPWLRARRMVIAVLLVALAAVTLALALEGRLGFGGHDGVAPARVAPTPPSLLPVPALRRISTDAAGSEIAHALYPSAALRRQGSFYVYLPPGFRSASEAGAARYPVLYLLHGNSQKATAFLDIGLQDELDGLIRAHAIPPLIAVMIQGGGGANNWRNINNQYYESYVLEVQEIVDRMLPTVADRGGRAIAGVSMGGYGAMELALDNPSRFATVESWLGFFDGLEGQLAIDRPEIRRLGLNAFVYGGAEDKIADPSEDAPFAAALRAAGADAHSAVYPGEHNLETVQAHLPSMLTFAGRALAKGACGAPSGHAAPTGCAASNIH